VKIPRKKGNVTEKKVLRRSQQTQDDNSTISKQELMTPKKIQQYDKKHQTINQNT
jgi:hypothetical protein